MSDSPGGKRPTKKAPGKKTPKKKAPAKKAPAEMAAAKKAPTEKAAAQEAKAKGATTKKATATKAAAAKRVISAQPPARGEPQRGSLRDRLRKAPLMGAGGGEAEAIARRAAPSRETFAAAPRRGTVAVSVGSRLGNLARDVTDEKRVFTGPGGGKDSDQSERKRDDSFAKVIASKDVQKITTESLKRLEAARLSHVEMGLKASQAEWKGLRRERERLMEAKDTDKLALIDRYILLVEAEAQAGEEILKLAKKGRGQKGEITLFGRVLTAEGKPQADVQVVFVDGKGEVVKEIEPLKPDAEGFVWIGLKKDQVKIVLERGGQLSARVQVSGKEVAADPFTARLRIGSVYQFDLRIKDGKPSRTDKPTNKPGRVGNVTRPR